MSRVNPNLGGDANDPTLADAMPVPEGLPQASGGVPQLNLDPNSIPSVGDVMTQQGDVPGLLSTIQLGSSMRSWAVASPNIFESVADFQVVLAGLTLTIVC